MVDVYTGISKVIKSDELELDIRDSLSYIFYFITVRTGNMIEDRHFNDQFADMKILLKDNKTKLSYNQMADANLPVDQNKFDNKMNDMLNYCIQHQYIFFIELDKRYYIIDSIDKKVLVHDKSNYYHVYYKYTLDVSRISK